MSVSRIGEKCLRVFGIYGRKEDAIKLLPFVCNPHELKDFDQQTLLHWACYHGWMDIVVKLIEEYRLDPMCRDWFGNTCLHKACHQRGNLDIIMYLNRECLLDPSCTNDGSNTLLHVACRNAYGDIEMVQYLINQFSCDPMAQNNFGNTPLHMACINKDIVIVQYLITCKCNPMSKNDRGNTPLHVACKNGDMQMVQSMIGECHYDLMSKNNDGNTPLHLAYRHEDAQMVQCLIRHCNPMCKDDEGNTLLHLLCAHSDYEFSIPAIEYILSIGKINPLAKNNLGEAPLMLASSGKSKQIVKAIFAKFGRIQISHPVHSYVNVVLLGNHGVGKSTLAQVIIQRSSGVFASVRGIFRYVKGVELCTAGIIPSKLEHRELGNVILHDSAGQSEYYSSHIAVLENLLHGSAAVFIIVVRLSEKDVCKHLHHWLSIVENECHKALRQCHLVILASHIDEVDQKDRPAIYRKLDDITSSRLSQQNSIIVNCGLVPLDCRRLAGGELSSFTTTLSSACQSIRSTNRREMSLYCHMLFALLQEREDTF